MCRLAALLGDGEPASLKARTTRESWELWERFYEQDPWGELRADFRAMAIEHRGWGTDERPDLPWPYWPSDEERADQDDRERDRLEELKESFDPAVIAEKFRKGREEHEAKKKAKQK